MIGQTIAHYQILEKLGEGGMGVVYKARDTHLDRFVAIKVLPPERVADPERKRRFVQEAKAASALNHPNIITIYDISSAEVAQAPRPATPGGLQGPPHHIDFIAMEYVAGKTLDQLIPRKGMPLSQALKCAVQIADGLAKAHSGGIIHRDLKPGNVIVTEDGLVKVLDFGLAKLTEPLVGQDAPTQTAQGTIVGTVAYMSPEQAEGKPVDARSDIFSFGSVLYEMLTGRRAFKGESAVSTLSAILHQEPSPLGEEIPGELRRVVRRCLRKDPARRFQTMADLKVALEELKEESDSGALGAAPTGVGARRASPLRWVAAAVGIALIAAGLWLRFGPRPSPYPTPRIVPLTSDPGVEMHPSFSPDGTQVVYAWNGEKQDNYDIYVKHIESGDRLRLTTDPAYELSPAWSPDGRWIAFLRALAGEKTGVFLVSPLGGREQKLADLYAPQVALGLVSLGPYLAWSADGQWLALVDRESPTGPWGLYLLSVLKREKRRLTSLPTPFFGDFDPAFSPDGRTLAFVRHRSHGVGDLHLQALTADLRPRGEPVRLTTGVRFAGSPVWTPNGHEIVYAAGASWLDCDIWRVAVPGPAASQRLAFGEGVGSLAMSRQGTRLVYGRESRDYNLWRLELARPGVAAGSPVRLASSTRVDWFPSYSPDGRKICFSSNRSGNYELFVGDADGSHAAPVAGTSSDFIGVTRWSPDGRRIVLASSREGQRDLQLINADGSQPRWLTSHPGDDVFPVWSRDGKWIYFGSNRSGEFQAWKIRADPEDAPREPVQVTKSGAYAAAFESLDGKFLYYTRARGITSLWKVPIEGGQETLVTEPVFSWDWAVAKEGVYLIQPRGAFRPIAFLDLTTGRTSSLVEGLVSVEGLALSPDGRFLLYAPVDARASDLMLVENFR